ncbi:sucrose-6-phosphate hydrolase [Lacticaseibacillus rhamnosus]|uniref:sucrose-6-phosphate hydrolase n=1 Tax=Lacticaseibacillus rhamnosus TaxID=47715 RepID=UPI00237F2459|nr:sucrose-6-phosphate hydrolase [Lacticaseibacillus rhamnosus]MDE3296969.1 sucrose-6-phosphate hydrolase [Lacticaseibacillus rhamnosus]
MTDSIENMAKRYQPYSTWTPEYVASLKAEVAASQWRTKTHIQPDTGLINDPCSLNFFNGKWHLYYQQFPFGPVHGLKSWAHVVSKDLFNWRRVPGDLLPDNELDAQGAYTGSALVTHGTLRIMYTGNVRDEQWHRQSTQLGAVLGADSRLYKDPKPLIANPPAGYTQEFRDPFLFNYQDKTYVLIGGQRADHTGAILLYEKQPDKTWRYVAPLSIPDEFCGYMVECPNIAFINGKVVLVYCPQGLDQDFFEYENVYPNIALVADSFDPETGTLTHQRLQNIDKGFDFYATRLANTEKDGTLAISWLGLPDTNYPTDADGWEGVLSYVRQLDLRDGHVCLKPHPNIEQLRETAADALPVVSHNTDQWSVTALSGAFELSMTLAAGQKAIVHVPDGDHDQLLINLDSDSGQGMVQRENRNNGGSLRQFGFPAGKTVTIRLFVDVSVFELFIDDGYRVVSGRFFGDTCPTAARVNPPTAVSNVQAWNLRKDNGGL